MTLLLATKRTARAMGLVVRSSERYCTRLGTRQTRDGVTRLLVGIFEFVKEAGEHTLCLAKLFAGRTGSRPPDICGSRTSGRP